MDLPGITFALIRQADTPADALGEGEADTFLKLADLVTDGAAGQVQFTGRNRHAACAGDCIQRAKSGHRRKAHKSSRLVVSGSYGDVNRTVRPKKIDCCIG
ncbi:hypothetical protein D9M73_182680 [compost metagenome]